MNVKFKIIGIMNGVIDLFETLLPIFVMVVLPVMVVWLVTRARLKKNEQKMAVLVKAIENGVDIDPALLVSETEGGRNTCLLYTSPSPRD